jgi:uncharacterized membrane protein
VGATFPAALLVLCGAWAALFITQAGATVLRYCAEHYDFGIYVQAIARFSWGDLNPWLSARGLRIFNDHFDPLLLAAVIPRLALPPHWAGFASEQLFVLGSTLPIAWLWRKGGLGGWDALLCCALLLFSIGTLDAVLFPIHPTTWSLFPAALLGVAWARKSFPGVLVASALFFACKEEHVFCGPLIALALWLGGQRRAAWGVGALALGWGLFAFALRPLLWGSTTAYFSQVVATFRAHPVEALEASVRAPQLRRLGTLLLPFVPLAGWATWARRLPPWPLWVATAPLLASRFLLGKWHFQYGPPLVGLWVAALIPALSGARLPRWVVWIALMVLASSSQSLIRPALSRLLPSAPAACPADPQRLADIRAGLAFLEQHPEGAAWVGNTLVAAAARREEIYSFTSSERLSSLPYRYLLIEKPPTGYFWPLSDEEASRRLAEYLARPGTSVVMDTRYVVLAEGDF